MPTLNTKRSVRDIEDHEGREAAILDVIKTKFEPVLGPLVQAGRKGMSGWTNHELARQLRPAIRDTLTDTEITREFLLGCRTVAKLTFRLKRNANIK